jgi:hypothetical protein
MPKELSTWLGLPNLVHYYRHSVVHRAMEQAVPQTRLSQPSSARFFGRMALNGSPIAIAISNRARFTNSNAAAKTEN